MLSTKVEHLLLSLSLFFLVFLTACASTVSVDDTDPLQDPSQLATEIEDFRQHMMESHDKVMFAYEALDARYADIEINGGVTDALSDHISQMRLSYLQMQNRHGQMLQHHNQLVDVHQNGASSGARRLEEFQYHRHLALVINNHEELIALNREMAALARAEDRDDMAARHDALSDQHEALSRTSEQMMNYLEKKVGVDPGNESLTDPLEGTPDESNTPDNTRLL